MRRFFSKRFMLFFFILAVLAGALGFFLSLERVYPVEAAEAGVGSIEEVIKVSGYIDAEDTEKVLSNAQGIISNIIIKTGDRIKKGKVLCEVRSPDLRKNILEMQAELMVANAKLAMAANPHEKALAEARKKFILSNIFDIEETIYPKAHINGEVVNKTVQNGSKVVPGQVMFFLADTSNPILIARMDESHTQKIKVGQPVVIGGDFLNGNTLAGKVSKVGGSVKRENGTFIEANCTIFNPRGLVIKHGAFADADITTARHDNVVAVPRSALIADPAPHVFVERDGRAYHRPVKIGIIGLRSVEILEGVNAGEKVITYGNLNLKDGVKVDIRSAN